MPVSNENRTIPVISGSGNPAIDLRRPRKDTPAALQLPENSTPGSQEPVTDASNTFIIFHGLGANHFCSYPFLHITKFNFSLQFLSVQVFRSSSLFLLKDHRKNRDATAAGQAMASPQERQSEYRQ